MQVTSATEQQSAVAGEINRSVLHINDMASESAAAVEQISRSSTELAQLSEALQDMVQRFKL